MARRDIVVIGASSGGVFAMRDLVSTLPSDLEAAILMVQHIRPDAESVLPELLSRAGPLPAVHARDGQSIEKAKIYVAPPDHHLIIEDGSMAVTKGPRENRFRPSIDALFRSAAYTYGPRAIGVVLTGSLSDGTSGLWIIKRRGGVAVVQDPEDADYPSMPTSALQHVDVDHTVSLADLGRLLVRLTEEEAPEPSNISAVDKQRLKLEVQIAAEDHALEKGVMDLGELAPMSCPECNGFIITIREGDRVRYRCHTGHAFTPEAILAGISETVGDNLWQAIRGLEESVILLDHMLEHAREAGDHETAQKLAQKKDLYSERIESLRAVVFRHKATGGVVERAEESISKRE